MKTRPAVAVSLVVLIACASIQPAGAQSRYTVTEIVVGSQTTALGMNGAGAVVGYATMPDAKLYPEYDELLKFAMLDETRAYFRELLTGFADATPLSSASVWAFGS